MNKKKKGKYHGVGPSRPEGKSFHENVCFGIKVWKQLIVHAKVNGIAYCFTLFEVISCDPVVHWLVSMQKFDLLWICLLSKFVLRSESLRMQARLDGESHEISFRQHL